MDRFTFKGIFSDAMGIVVEKMPIITKPQRRVESKTIPGRHGSLHESDGAYEDITLSIDCFLPDPGRMDDVFAWLDGRGDLLLSSVPGRAFRAQVVNQIPLSKIVEALSASRFSVIFSSQPFRYEADPQPVVLKSMGVVTNPGTIPSEPVIIVRGNGNITLMVGGKTLLIDDVSGGVVIDCAAGMVYKPGEPKVL